MNPLGILKNGCCYTCLLSNWVKFFPCINDQLRMGLVGLADQQQSFWGLSNLCVLFCCFSVGTFGTNFPRLIVNQFKWLDRLLDSQVGTRGAITWMLFPNNFWNASQVGLDWIIVLMRTDVSVFTCWGLIFFSFVMIALSEFWTS